MIKEELLIPSPKRKDVYRILNGVNEQHKYVRLLGQVGKFPLKIDCIALTPDGSSLAIAAAGSGISIWGMESYAQQCVLEMPEEAFLPPDQNGYHTSPNVPIMVRDLAFSKDGTFVAAAFTNNEVSISIREGTLLETIKRPAVSLTFIPPNDLLALCLADGHVEFWTVAPARLISSSIKIPDRVVDRLQTVKKLSRCSVACSSDGRQLALLSTFYDKKRMKARSYVHIWSLIQQNGLIEYALQRMIQGPTQFFERGSYLQERHHLFCSAYADPFWGIDTDTGETIALISEDIFWHRSRICSLSPDGKLAAISMIDGEVLIWNVQGQSELFRFKAHQVVKEGFDAVGAITWLPDGERLVTVGTSQAKSDSPKRSPGKEPLSSFRQTTIKIWHIRL